MMLSLPLPPDVGMRLLLRALGGPGSGNFGHSGRPGEVGGSASRDSVGLDRAIKEEYIPWDPYEVATLERLYDRAAELDFPPDKIRITTTGRRFTVGGETFEEGASYSRATGNITFQVDMLRRDADAAEVTLAHEVAHRDWHDVEVGLGLNYTVGTARVANLDAAQVNRVVASIRNRSPELQEKDGVTGYSRAYWKDVEISDASSFRRMDGHKKYLAAVNETLAEISALEATPSSTGFLAVPDVWLNLHRDVRQLSKSIRENR